MSALDLTGVERILVVTAHPDDVDFGFAGSVAQFTDAGIDVTYCIVTDGDAGGAETGTPREEMAPLRRDEQTAAAAVVGVHDLRFLGYPDGRVESTLDLRRDISRVIRDVRPQRVMGQSPERNLDRIYASHPDHLAVGDATLCAVYPDARNRWAHPELEAEGWEPWAVDETWIGGGIERDPLHRHHHVDRSQDRGVALAQESASRSGGDWRHGAGLDHDDRGRGRTPKGPVRRSRARYRHPLNGRIAMTVSHPLEMLTGDEIIRTTEILRASGRVADTALFAHMVLHEPEKEALAGWQPNDPIDRRVRVVVVPGPTMDLHEAIVSVTKGEIVDWRDVDDMRPALLITEAFGAIVTTKEHPDYIAALAKRGITDLDLVQIDPWPAGVFGYECEEGRRISRCISFLHSEASDNGYARPIEGLIVHFDMAANVVLEVIDHGVTSIPPNHGSYYAEHQPSMREDLKPISITQPEGVSFTVTGTSSTGRSGSSGSGSIRTRGWCCTRSPTPTTVGDGRSCTARRSRRWSFPTGIRARYTAGRTRSTRASGDWAG